MVSHPVRHPRRAAQGLVELALVLPLFMLFVCAIVDFARVYNAQETLHRLTKEAVNIGARLKSDGTRPTTAEVQTLLQSTVLPPLVPSQVVVNAVDAAKKDAKGRRSVFVDVSYNLPLLTPMMDRFFPGSQAPLASVAQLPYPHSHPTKASPPPNFTVDPSGAINPNIDMRAVLRVLGKQLQYGAGGAAIPVTMKMKLEKEKDAAGKPFETIFGGNPVNGGEEMSLGDVKKDEVLSFSARARHSSGGTVLFDQTYTSDSPAVFTDVSFPYHVQVLRKGDAAPDKAPFGEQESLASYLVPYVDKATKTMKMGKDDVIVLWEFNPQYNSAASDYQDLAILVQLSPRSGDGDDD